MSARYVCRADVVVAGEPGTLRGHVVIHHRSGRAHGVRILGEDAGHDLHPVGFEHAVGVDASQHVAGCGVQTEVAGRDQSLILVLLQQDDRSFGMVALELFDDVAGAVRGTVVDDDHFMWCDGLARGVHQAVGDALLLIPRGMIIETLSILTG